MKKIFIWIFALFLLFGSVNASVLTPKDKLNLWINSFASFAVFPDKPEVVGGPPVQFVNQEGFAPESGQWAQNNQIFPKVQWSESRFWGKGFKSMPDGKDCILQDLAGFNCMVIPNDDDLEEIAYVMFINDKFYSKHYKPNADNISDFSQEELSNWISNRSSASGLYMGANEIEIIWKAKRCTFSSLGGETKMGCGVTTYYTRLTLEAKQSCLAEDQYLQKSCPAGTTKKIIKDAFIDDKGCFVPSTFTCNGITNTDACPVGSGYDFLNNQCILITCGGEFETLDKCKTAHPASTTQTSTSIQTSTQTSKTTTQTNPLQEVISEDLSSSSFLIVIVILVIGGLFLFFRNR